MANSLTGAVENGVYTKTTASQEATGTATTSTSGNEYNQEMFLQLLVAEMQYQDPLEPTSNTEYVSELASFTQIEAVQAVQDQMQTLEANSLVGQYVILLDDNSEYVSGKVDYVMNDSGDLYLAVNDSLYTIDQLDSVVDESYYTAVLDAKAFTEAVSKLPTTAALELSDESALTSAREMYDAMDDYTKTYVASSTVETLTELETRLAALKAAASSSSESSDSTSDESEESTDDSTTIEEESDE